MKPWDEEVQSYLATLQGKLRDKEEFGLWSLVKANEFYFSVEDQDKIITVTICPIDYFKRNKQLFHDSMPINHILPNYLVEKVVSVYETREFDYSEVNEDLHLLGFAYNVEFELYVFRTANIWGKQLAL